MSTIYNIYCDESCHLEHDRQEVMVLGAVWCPAASTRQFFTQIRQIKIQHQLQPNFEIKWTKVSPAKTQFYLDVINYFFNQDDLHFRALIVPEKSKLRHEDFKQKHDTWYYKMYFDMLKVILNPQDRYRIYLDVKDSRSAAKVAKLHEVLSNDIYDFHKQIVERVQVVRSHEVELIQLADLLIGAVSYANRGLSENLAKVALVREMRQRSGYQLTRSTLVREGKVNIFRWHSTEMSL